MSSGEVMRQTAERTGDLVDARAGEVAPVSVVVPATAESTSPTSCPPPAPTPANKRRYDRSIVEGPLRAAVWKIAWPTMLTNIVGGMQGIVDHALVGHLVGFRRTPPSA